MAVVTITITDKEDRSAHVQCISDPPVTDNDEDATNAQVTGALMMKLLESIQKEILAELKSEGKGE